MPPSRLLVLRRMMRTVPASDLAAARFELHVASACRSVYPIPPAVLLAESWVSTLINRRLGPHPVGPPRRSSRISASGALTISWLPYAVTRPGRQYRLGYREHFLAHAVVELMTSVAACSGRQMLSATASSVIRGLITGSSASLRPIAHDPMPCRTLRRMRTRAGSRYRA